MLTRRGKFQHVFKKQKSTLTVGLVLQLIIAYHLDINEYVSIASLDLSAAFDIVNTATIIKRIETIGIPNNIIRLLKTWLTNRSYYMSVNGVNLLVVNLTWGTIQGYILGPLFTLSMYHHCLT